MTPDRAEAERMVRIAEEHYASGQWGKCEQALFAYFKWRHPYNTFSINDIEQRAVDLDDLVANGDQPGYRELPPPKLTRNDAGLGGLIRGLEHPSAD